MAIQFTPTIGGNNSIGTYQHNQNIPSTTWHIVHGLGCYPSVTVVDTAGSVVEGEVKYVDENNIELTFSASFAGKAYLNY